jgi:L,D-transpeptidase catalytic domain
MSRWLALGALAVVLVTGSLAPSRAAAAPTCGGGAASTSAIGSPSGPLAWRAAPVGAPPIYRGVPGAGGRRSGALDPDAADWFLVIGAARGRGGRCWARLRLSGRPDDASGWVARRRLILRPTPWRLVVSTRARTLTVLRSGHRVRVLPVVVGAPTTPTPRGLFSIVHVWRSDPDAFVGSWVLGLTAHSEVLRHFEGGSGEVGIHGRGGASLLDPLGSAASHGCIRVANRSIDRLVWMVGRQNLSGIPVIVRR